MVSKAYSSVNYLLGEFMLRLFLTNGAYQTYFSALVDPYTESGQSLYRQYADKRLKVVLSYRWVTECIAKGGLQTYASGWAGCKVTGNEMYA